jgi:SnoaL-like domain
MTQPDGPLNMEQLAREVRYLRDRLDIVDCINRYCRGVDRLDVELVNSAYHADAMDDRGAFVGHPSEYIEWLLPILKDAAGTSHNVSNISCEIQGDIAHAESYVITCVWSKDGKSVVMGGARYIDRLERRQGVWALAHREAPMDFTFRAPTQQLPPGALGGTRSPDDRSYTRPLGLSPDAKRRWEEKQSKPA